MDNKTISCVHENDLISRQQAIDALTEYGNGRAVFISVGEAVIRIEQLPSAQPAFDARDTQYNLPIGTDCISRQVAIDTILGQPPEPHYPSWYAEQIKELPPAQPEIIRCKDCRYYNSEEKECLDLLGHGRRWEEDDFCSYAERGEVTE